MSEVKWIKIATDIFDNEKIKLIESMPEGDAIIVVWFKILALAGNINEGGYIFLTKDIPYTEQMLSTLFNRPVSTIQLALSTFEKFKMIEIVDDIIHVSNWEKYQNVEGMERIREQTRARVARFRETKRLEMESQTCSYCGEIATGYDHIIATSRGGSDEDYNKTPCCKRCNQIKNDKPLVDFLNNNRDIVRDDLIAKNPKLKRYVTLCNVTNRYTVTECNALDIDKEKEEEKEKKHIYGDYKHVKLTDKQYSRLIADYGEQAVLSGIKKVDEYCQKKGKTYKDYNLVLRDWGIDAPKLPPKKEESEEDKPSEEWQKMFEEE